MPEPLSNSSIDLTQPVKPATNTPDDINEFLKPDKDEPEVKEPEAKKAKEPDEDEDEDKIELKGDEEDEEEKLDLKEGEDEEVEVEAPPRKKDVVSKYPNFFKEFPWFEKMMFRDKQYTELFGSFDDAKEAASRAQNLAEFEQDLMEGNTGRVLASVKELDKKAFDKIVDNYLPTLAKVDKEAYFDVVLNMGKTVIREMAMEAKRTGNEDLQKAALLLNQFLTGTSEYTPPKQRVKEDKTEDNELQKERENFVRERFETARNDLQTRVDNVLRATISDYIDPKGEMSPYVKKNAVRDALQQLHNSLGQDTGFRHNLDKLWEVAFQDKFSQNSLRRIQSTYLGRSKQSLATIIKKARAEALKDSVPSSRKSKDEDEDETPRAKRGPLSPGRPRHSSGNAQRQKGESVLDFLSRD